MIRNRVKNQGRHVARWEASRWRRKVLGIPVIGWVVGAAATALAVVGFIVLLGTSGEVNSAGAINVQYGMADPTGTPVAGPLTGCSGERIGNTEIRLVIDNALPGSACEFTVPVLNLASAQTVARLGGFRLDSAAFASGDVRATVAECGQSIAINDEEMVTFTIWVDDLAPGTQLVFNPALDGLEWAAAALYNPAECVQT